VVNQSFKWRFHELLANAMSHIAKHERMRDAKHVETRVAKARGATRAPHRDIDLDIVGNARSASAKMRRHLVDAQRAPIGETIQSIVFLQRLRRARNCATSIRATSAA